MRDLVRLIALVIGVIAVTVTIDDRFLLRVVALTLVWAAAGVAWNLVAKGGQISLAHSAFVGIGAYTFTALARREPPISPWIGMLVGMVLAALVAIVIGFPTLRLKGFYFTLGTLSVPLILELLFAHFGKPEQTVPFVPGGGWAFLEFSNGRTYVWLLLAVLVLFIGLTNVVDRSPFGFALSATRDNEVLARAVGVRTAGWKLTAFAISAAMLAVLGVLWVKAVLRVTVVEEVFSIEIVVVMLSVSAVGGVGYTWGPVLGAALLVPMSQMFDRWWGSSLPGIQYLVYGVALVAVAVLFPEGILTLIQKRRQGITDLQLSIPALRSRSGDSAPVPSDKLLEIHQVAKQFGAIVVLTDVELTIGPGERVGMIGPNGAGKTTLFNIITGHLQPEAGEVRFRGHDLAGMKAPGRYKLGISRTFQVPQGFPHMTVRDNVVVAALGAQSPHPIDDAIHWLERVGLGEKLGSDLSHLTVAETKFLELARAMVAHPQLLLLDEPLAGLNELERQRFFEIVDAVVTDEMSVLVIEHSVKSLLSNVDRLIALDQGQIIADGDPRDVVSSEHVIASYLGSRWTSHVGN